MYSNAPLVYGPAYLDYIAEIASPLLPQSGLVLDQSLPAYLSVPRDDSKIVLMSELDDCIVFVLPTQFAEQAASYQLCEAVLGRQMGFAQARAMRVTHDVTSFSVQLGGMGAGYALALRGNLRLPLGNDKIGRKVLAELFSYNIPAIPAILADCSTDTSLVILSPRGDKLAVGVRQAMKIWQSNEDDSSLLATASSLVFAGASNRLMAELLKNCLPIPVMCAPAMRNVCDEESPLAEMAEKISYLSLNALEWQYLPERDYCRATIPVITITEGAAGCRVLLKSGEEFSLPANYVAGSINTNRAGETYGSSFFKVLIKHAPGFNYNGLVSEKVARYAAKIALRQAARQLEIEHFAFPLDDWE